MGSLAIDHFSKALAIEDDAVDRVNRSQAYLQMSRCAEAATDAESALSLEPRMGVGYHTSAEAFSILASCHAYNGDFEVAAQHLETAIALAEQHQYPAEELAMMKDTLIDIQPP